MAAKKRARPMLTPNGDPWFGDDSLDLAHGVDMRMRLPGQPNGDLFFVRPVAEDVITQETRGARALGNDRTRIVKFPRNGMKRHDEHLRALGFTIPEEKDSGDDKLLYEMRLPDGWSSKHDPRDHRSMYFADPSGNWRVLVWLKDTSYDRATQHDVLTRFSIALDRHEKTHAVTAFVLDRKSPNRNHRPVHVMAPVMPEEDSWESRDKAEEAARKLACAWCSANGIDLDNPLANWSDPNLPTVNDGVHPYSKYEKG